MPLEGKTITTLNNKEYVILTTLKHNDVEYAFANEVKNDEVTENYYVLKILNNNVKVITDEELINTLLPKFQEKLKIIIEENM